ncbi:hypothetical protein FG386_002779 [Cryptosporidium ryanae]|uniref:uncharacterized protein n=1 Tax=Cryptosporidium ryanae TaxID=515981 RepID=UPI00351A800B|nr:hypothetical protein FG386_002779 [Cryptosporidium ryanae]
MEGVSEKKIERCPFLSTINRNLLDFDYEKICSLTLREENVYCCLVCGLNYHGRGKDSVAYKHSLEMNHHLFINLENSNIYCLPNNYEIVEHSLEDIKNYLHPCFNINGDYKKLYNASKTFDKIEYLPGYIGISNFGNNDSLNVILLLLSQITNFRNMCIEYNLYDEFVENRISDPFIFNMIESIKKIYSPFNLKGKYSPYTLASIIEKKSQGKFNFSKLSSNKVSRNKVEIIDPMALLSWIIFQLKKKLKRYLNNSFQKKYSPEIEVNESSNGDKNNKFDLISSCIQGELYSGSSKNVINNKKLNKNDNAENCNIYFNCITLQLPPIIETKMSTFNNNNNTRVNSNLTPQIPIYKLLDSKFFSSTNSLLIWKLPCYLIIHIGRFTKSTLNIEKNKTLVSFPLVDLDLSAYLHPDAIKMNPNTKYNLINNISHKNYLERSKFVSQLLHPYRDEWIEIEDLNVQTVLPQAIILNESYLLLYKRSDLL